MLFLWPSKIFDGHFRLCGWGRMINLNRTDATLGNIFAHLDVVIENIHPLSGKFIKSWESRPVADVLGFAVVVHGIETYIVGEAGLPCGEQLGVVAKEHGSPDDFHRWPKSGEHCAAANIKLGVGRSSNERARMSGLEENPPTR